MGLFDILQNVDFGSALNQLSKQAKGLAASNGPLGGVGGVLGAGALGAMLSNIMSDNVAKGVTMAGLGAVAWNFFQKWAQSQQNQQKQPQQQPFQQQQQQMRPVTAPDNVAELVARSMIYAAKADGNIDAVEQSRINAVLKNMLPNQNLDVVVEQIEKEPVDPTKVAAAVYSPEQAEDVFRLSCVAIDIDQFMEKSYLNALADALKINSNRRDEIMREADAARKQLTQALGPA